MSSMHKPRRKPQNGFSSPQPSRVMVDSPRKNVSPAVAPANTLEEILWPFRGYTASWLHLPIILIATGLFRWAVSLWGYSGYNKPPMHGDFEAQRHWMEITASLPLTRWYFYDLPYWGLDYPPLTAYHSWLFGKIGNSINAEWFALDASRGIETPSVKLYMRASVLISEFLSYIPALVFLIRKQRRVNGIPRWQSIVALTAILWQPATMIIDHGHFQYNTVMLGFMVATISCFTSDHNLWACFFFVGALTFKQMALYYAPVVFCYLLGICFFPRVNVSRLVSIAVVTLLSFGVVVLPFVLAAIQDHSRGIVGPPVSEHPFLLELILSIIPASARPEPSSLVHSILLQLTQMVHRVFPLARGLFEDKVANAWCTIHVFYKLNRFPVALLSRVSLLSTLASIGPACLIILLKPRKNLLLYALSSCAWGFFLFSFQVHEKSVLLPLLPMTLLLGNESTISPSVRAWVTWANTFGMWTMYPLLARDELKTPYFVLLSLWNVLLFSPSYGVPLFTQLIHYTSMAAMVTWHVLEFTIEAPLGKPDLWVVLNCIIGAGGFGICYLWCTWTLFEKSGLWYEVQETKVKKTQ